MKVMVIEIKNEEEYLDKIGTYSRDIIIDLPVSHTKKIQLAIEIRFISPKDVNEMHSKNGDIKCISRNDANEAVSELFKSFLSRFEGNLETSITESDSIFDSVQMMFHKCRKVYSRSGSSYIDSPHWIKKRKKKQ